MQRRSFLVSLIATSATLPASAMWVSGCDSATTVPPDSAAPGRADGVASAQSTQATSASPRFDELAGFCDGVEATNPAEYEERRERAKSTARDAGLAGLVVEAGVNLSYLTGVSWGQSERPLLMLLPVDGQPVWVGASFEHRTLEEKIIGEGRVVDWHEHESPYAAAVAALKVAGLAKGRVGVDAAMRVFVHEGLRKSAGKLRFEPAAGVFDACRMAKTVLELGRIRRANEATKAALAMASKHIVAGMTEAEIADLVRSAQQAAGLSQVWVLALTGPNASFPHGTKNGRPLEDGDLILVDTGGALHGYRSDITRTWAIGNPSDEQRKAWDAVLAAQTAGLEAVRPGAPCSGADAAARAVIEGAGFGKDYERFTHRLGHGIGLQVHEQPYLVRGNETKLVPGMTFSNEPGIYIPGKLGVRLEDIVAVTNDGAEVFGPRAKSLDDPFGVG